MRRIGLTAIGLLALTPAVANAEYGTVARGWPVMSPDGEMVTGPWGGPVLHHKWTDQLDPESVAALNLDGTTRWKNGVVIEGGITVILSPPLGPFALQANGMFGPTRGNGSATPDRYYDANGGIHTFGRRLLLEADLFATATTGTSGLNVTLTHADGTQIWQYHDAQPTEENDHVPIVNGGATLIFTEGPGGMLALNRSTGAVKWTVPNAAPSYRLGTDGVVAYVAGRGLVAFDATGAEVVPQRPQDYGKSFTKDGLRLEPTTEKGRYSLRAIRPNGTIAWQYSTTTPVGHAIGLPDGTVTFTTRSATSIDPANILTRLSPAAPRLRATALSIRLSRTTFGAPCTDLRPPLPPGFATCAHGQGRGGLLRIASPIGTTMSVRFKGTRTSQWTVLPVPAGNSFTRVDWFAGKYTLQVRRGTTGPIIRSIPVTITK